MEIFALIFEIVIPPIIIPLVMIIAGASFMNGAPKEINQIYGYRTEMSMKNRDTWEFAHRFYGRLSFVSGLILLPLTVAAIALLSKRFSVTTAILAVAGVQILLLLALILATEVALRVKFDKGGGRKK